MRCGKQPMSARPPLTLLKDTEIAFGSRDWWACMIYEKLRNYDVAKRRHHTNIAGAPTCIDELPQAPEPQRPARQAGDDVETPGNEDSDASEGLQMPIDGARDVEGVLAGDENRTGPRRRPGQEAPIAVTCGVLPPGTGLHHFHKPPLKTQARSAEAAYWRNFSTQWVKVSPNQDDTEVLKTQNTSWGISSLSAVAASESQRLFFKDIDKYQRDPDEPTNTAPTKRKTDAYDRTLAAAVQKLPRSYTRSPTVVMEAAFFLLHEGLLNIPEIGGINVKQARAFLWNAAWLQEHMNAQWAEEDVLRAKRARPEKVNALFTNFNLAIVGPGGTGKTAVLKVTEALINFFAGPETVQKLAPSNAAARLFGGDTIHAVCKLPFGKATLSSKTGRLTKPALTGLRRQWRNIIAAFLDEVSMIAADQFLQCDVRMRQAKQTTQQPFGGLAVNVCGDFLQLPPVDKDGSRHSLARPIDDTGHVAPEGDEEAEATAKAAHAESRQGFELWRSIAKVVCLNVNVRAPDALGKLQEEMRAGHISDET